MRIVAIVWSSYVPLLLEARRRVGELDLDVYSARTLARAPERVDAALAAAKSADLVFLYRTSDGFWQQIETALRGQAGPPVVCLGHDPSLWGLSTVPLRVLETSSLYLTHGGPDNAASLLRFWAREVLGHNVDAAPPAPQPWEGLYHPSAPRRHFADVPEYLAWYEGRAQTRGLAGRPTVGVLLSRHYWLLGELAVEDALIRALESEGLRVMPAFSLSVRDESLGSRGSAAAVRSFFLAEGGARIDALVKLQAFFLGRSRAEGASEAGRAKEGVELLQELNVPVFQPVVSFSKTISEWETDGQGLGSDIGWSVALPEFEGVIEPILIGALTRSSDQASGAEVESRTAIPERCRHLARRVARWTRLAHRPPAERRLAFVLHNAACASVEATVGSAAGLDAPESVARLLQTLAARGYAIAAPPQDGQELSSAIMDRKAISEFRWTTVDEIVAKGGVLAKVSEARYREWWSEFPAQVREHMQRAWGEPPGREVAGMPAAMVHEGAIVVTGLNYGNAVVCVQPKRGCAGARCEGQVCKILHDPEVPPPHQYVATYRWLAEDFGADAVIHVGTHGTLEFLPGKGVGLSPACLPDMILGDVPHLYLYNADNAPEGTIAKRRSYATLVDHMQTVMVASGLYDRLEELDRTLGEWEQAKTQDQNRAHVLEHIVAGHIRESHLEGELGLADWEHAPFVDVARAAHEALGRIRNTQMQDGMHIFGELPQGARRIDFVHAMLRHDVGETLSPRKIAGRLLGLDLRALLADPGAIDPDWQKSNGRLLEEVEHLARDLVGLCLAEASHDLANDVRRLCGNRLRDEAALSDLEALRTRVGDVAQRLDGSRESEALQNGLAAGYIPAGPSGLIFRGRDDVLPTGRNFFSLNPERVPTRAAAVVGRNLAQALIDKHLRDEGRVPENVAIYWMCADIMWSDGEGMAQILNLIGVRPCWLSNGLVRDFQIVPLAELGRPRIDVTLRVSGITRDNFPDRIAYLDRAIAAVAALDEPGELNFVRKHTLAQLAAKHADRDDGEAFRRASRRIFSAAPGTYRAGVNLAVYASAWKDSKDLSDIFLFWNGYAYGEGFFGEASHTELAHALTTVDVTFNKVVNDAHDLFGCCGYFGNHGGLSAAAGTLSGRSVRNYFGDTREPEQVAVRGLADEIRRVVRAKLLNPRWIEGMKRHGYKGAGDISKRVGRVFGWESTTGEVDDWVFDDIVRTFVANDENRRFFEEHNPWALEEMGRRLLEAQARGLWQADPEMLRELQDHYLEIESWIEERTGDVSGEFQGGAVDIVTADDVGEWGQAMAGIRSLVQGVTKRT